MPNEKLALLVVDMQKESKYGIDGMTEAVEAAARAIESCRERSIDIIYTRHIGRADKRGLINGDVLDDQGRPVYYRSDADTHEVLDDLAPHSGDVVIDKYRWSGFHETPLDLILRTAKIDNLIVCGFVTDCCVLTTVFDAFARNYGITLVKDACAATSSGAHKSAVLNMANWVYEIEIIDADQLVRKLSGEPHTSWISTGPDQMAFASHRLDEAYEALSTGLVRGEFDS
jgi:nicotinamidase-related amidase